MSLVVSSARTRARVRTHTLTHTHWQTNNHAYEQTSAGSRRSQTVFFFQRMIPISRRCRVRCGPHVKVNVGTGALPLSASHSERRGPPGSPGVPVCRSASDKPSATWETTAQPNVPGQGPSHDVSLAKLRLVLSVTRASY